MKMLSGDIILSTKLIKSEANIIHTNTCKFYHSTKNKKSKIHIVYKKKL